MNVLQILNHISIHRTFSKIQLD